MIHEVFLALGSNLGDRENNLMSAIGHIAAMPETTLMKVSNIYETEPVGFHEQDRFLNMAVSIKTGLAPQNLLHKIHEIEGLLKRERKIHWGPRTIDIDILIYDDIKVDTPMLQIPHPRMFERAFVLIPLQDVLAHHKVFPNKLDVLINECMDKKGLRFYKLLTEDNQRFTI